MSGHSHTLKLDLDVTSGDIRTLETRTGFHRFNRRLDKKILPVASFSSVSSTVGRRFDERY